MGEKALKAPLERRSFLSRLGRSAAAFTAVLGASAPAQAQSTTSQQWEPTRHEVDDWMDKIPGKHRFIMDTTEQNGFGTALFFTNNYYMANQTGYGLGDSDLAVIIVARHNSAPFAFNDAIWAKYGTAIAQRANVTDPKTKAAPTVNLYRVANYGDALPNRGTTVDALVRRGVHLAVCQLATRNYSRVIATATGGNADDIFSEIAANLVGNSHLVPAGIVAVNRAQERGYAFVNA